MCPEMGIYTQQDADIDIAVHNALAIAHGTVDDIADQTDIAAHAALFGLHNRIIRKTVPETVNNSVVLQDDDELLFPIAPNEVWLLECHLKYVSTAVADMKVNFTGPGGCTFGMILGVGVNTASSVTFLYSAPGADLLMGGLGATVVGPHFWVIIENGVNAGNIRLQWAQNTAEVSDTVMQANSSIIPHRIG